MIRGARGLLLSLASACALSCGGEAAVARVMNGHDIDGHFISPDAYAEYLDGAALEERGDFRAAEAAYERALDEDSGAAEIWARLGRVRCTGDPRASDEAFRRARLGGPDLGAVFRADAECALERDDVTRARTSAERAVAVEPGDAQASLLVIRALVRAGQPEPAERWLRAAKLLYPESAGLPASVRAMTDARAPGPVTISASPRAPSSAATAEVQPGVPSVSAQTAPSPSQSDAARRDAFAALDAALLSGDALAARNAAVRAHVGNAWLALRAVELGQPALAKESAELTLAAEPSNVDARIAALAAADLGRDDDALRRWATRLPRDGTAPSAFAVRVMTALLQRRIGTDAARAFGATATLPTTDGKTAPPSPR